MLNLQFFLISESGGIFLWGQAMFIIAQLLTGGLIHVNELDPIRRYLPSYSRPRKAGRYSAFQVILIIFSIFDCRYLENLAI